MTCDATLIFQLSTARSALPVQGAAVLVTDPITGRSTRLTTDQSGRTRVLCVTAPPLSWSQTPGSDGRPYSIYHADIRAEGYIPVRLTGIQVFAGQQSLQTVEMIPYEEGENITNTPGETIAEPEDPLEGAESRFGDAPLGLQREQDRVKAGTAPVLPRAELQREEPGRRPGGGAADTGEARVPAVPAGGLRPEPAPLADPSGEGGPGPEPPALAEAPADSELELPRAVQALAASERSGDDEDNIGPAAPPVTRDLAETEVLTGPRAASQVYVPEYITVHLGAPNDTSARNVTVSFRDYIKNVASSEIYPTWPEAALRANILAQITFAQNRIFTEWYPSRGYNFNITNNTAYDQYFVYGRNIFTNISRLVDELFDQYIRRRGAVNPIFSQYCNGTTVTCGGLSQWGTVALANNGYTPLGILRYYYGDDIVIDTATVQRRITSSYPGSPLTIGSRGEDVRTIRTWLNRIRRNYPAIPAISTSGDTYNAEMQRAVQAFQRIFNLTPDGIVGPATWNKIAYIYVAVMRLAELGGEDIPLPAERPSGTLRRGSSGETVRLAQYFLRVIALYDDEIPPITIDGSFGPATENAVRAFQKMQGLTVDGIIGPATWNALYERFLGINRTTGLAVTYPGTPLRSGSRGDNVRVVQEYLNTLAGAYPLPRVTVDGIYGPATENAVQAFQRLFGLTADGIVGPRTWERLVGTRLLLR